MLRIRIRISVILVIILLPMLTAYTVFIIKKDIVESNLVFLLFPTVIGACVALGAFIFAFFSNERKQIELLLMILSLVVVFGILLLAGVDSLKKEKYNKVAVAYNKTLKELEASPGQGWDEWMALWSEPNMTWEKLGENWFMVEDEWKEIGLNVSWSEVDDIMQLYFNRYGIIYKDQFERSIFHYINEPESEGGKAKDIPYPNNEPFAAILAGCFALSFAMLMMTFLLNGLDVPIYFIIPFYILGAPAALVCVFPLMGFKAKK